MVEASATIGGVVAGTANFSEEKARKIKAYFDRRDLGHLLSNAVLQNIKDKLSKGPEYSRSAVFYALCVVNAAQKGVIERFGLNLTKEKSFTYTLAERLAHDFVQGKPVGDGAVHELFHEIASTPGISYNKDFGHTAFRHYFGLNGDL